MGSNNSAAANAIMKEINEDWFTCNYREENGVKEVHFKFRLPAAGSDASGASGSGAKQTTVQQHSGGAGGQTGPRITSANDQQPPRQQQQALDAEGPASQGTFTNQRDGNENAEDQYRHWRDRHIILKLNDELINRLQSYLTYASDNLGKEPALMIAHSHWKYAPGDWHLGFTSPLHDDGDWRFTTDVRDISLDSEAARAHKKINLWGFSNTMGDDALKHALPPTARQIRDLQQNNDRKVKDIGIVWVPESPTEQSDQIDKELAVSRAQEQALGRPKPKDPSTNANDKAAPPDGEDDLYTTSRAPSPAAGPTNRTQTLNTRSASSRSDERRPVPDQNPTLGQGAFYSVDSSRGFKNSASSSSGQNSHKARRELKQPSAAGRDLDTSSEGQRPAAKRKASEDEVIPKSQKRPRQIRDDAAPLDDEIELFDPKTKEKWKYRKRGILTAEQKALKETIASAQQAAAERQQPFGAGNVRRSSRAVKERSQSVAPAPPSAKDRTRQNSKASTKPARKAAAPAQSHTATFPGLATYSAGVSVGQPSQAKRKNAELEDIDEQDESSAAGETNEGSPSKKARMHSSAPSPQVYSPERRKPSKSLRSRTPPPADDNIVVNPTGRNNGKTEVQDRDEETGDQPDVDDGPAEDDGSSLRSKYKGGRTKR